MATMNLTKEAVLAALSKVQEPELHKDLVTLNMVRDVEIKGDRVSFSIILTTPACPLRTKIENEARQAVLAIGAKTVDLKVGANVPSDGKTRGILSVPVRNVVAVASGKGGVGKSTVAVNMAVALARSGARVGLLDADIYGPNVPTMMGVDQMPAPKGNKLIPAETYGVKMMSIGFLVKPGQPLIWRGPMLHSAIRQFLGDVEWDELDYLIIDLPPGTGDAQLSLAQSIPISGGVIVTMPQKVSLEDASRALAMFKELNVPILGIVENMSYMEMPDGSRMEIFGKGAGLELAKMADVPLIGVVPLDPMVRAGGDDGKPVVYSNPDSAAAKALIAISEKVAALLSVAALRADKGVSLNIVG